VNGVHWANCYAEPLHDGGPAEWRDPATLWRALSIARPKVQSLPGAGRYTGGGIERVVVWRQLRAELDIEALSGGPLTLELTPECILEAHAERIQIGRVSEQTGLSVDAIRFYEKHRFLARPPRTEGGFRLFNAEDIQRILFIRRAQQLGFSLPEIRELLVLQRDEGKACSHVRDLLRAKVGTVRKKIRELRILEEQSDKKASEVRTQPEGGGKFLSGRVPCAPGNFASRAR
jgi:DNA-binding transcriptional MerR regulator